MEELEAVLEQAVMVGQKLTTLLRPYECMFMSILNGKTLDEMELSERVRLGNLILFAQRAAATIKEMKEPS